MKRIMNPCWAKRVAEVVFGVLIAVALGGCGGGGFTAVNPVAREITYTRIGNDDSTPPRVTLYAQQGGGPGVSVESGGSDKVYSPFNKLAGMTVSAAASDVESGIQKLEILVYDDFTPCYQDGCQLTQALINPPAPLVTPQLHPGQIAEVNRRLNGTLDFTMSIPQQPPQPQYSWRYSMGVQARATNNFGLVAETPVISVYLQEPTLTTFFSPTQVHWFDVLPVGETGDETAAIPGIFMTPTCTLWDIFIELLDKDGNVTISDRFAAEDLGTGANITSELLGTNDTTVGVHWWFDAYNTSRYRIRYVGQGDNCP